MTPAHLSTGACKREESFGGAATLYLEDEPKLRLYLKHLDKSLWFGSGVNYRFGQRNPEKLLSFPLSQSAFQKAEAGNYYGFIQAKRGLRAQADSSL